MAGEVLIVISGMVDPTREDEFVAGYEKLASAELPDGLLRTELLRGQGGEWRIETLFRDQAAVNAMRSRREPPPAPQLFRDVGAEPSLIVFDVVARRSASPE